MPGGRPPKPKTEKHARLTIPLPPELAGRARDMSTREGVSLSAMIASALERELARLRDQSLDEQKSNASSDNRSQSYPVFVRISGF